MLKELFKNIINRKPKESDDRTVLITFKDSLPKGEHNPRFVSAEKFTHKGQTYVSLQYLWYGGENADIIKIVVSQERHDALWERARKEWAEEREEERKLWEGRDEEFRNFRISGPTPFDQIKRNRSVCGEQEKKQTNMGDNIEFEVKSIGRLMGGEAYKVRVPDGYEVVLLSDGVFVVRDKEAVKDSIRIMNAFREHEPEFFQALLQSVGMKEEIIDKQVADMMRKISDNLKGQDVVRRENNSVCG